jgi:hypothetical protein
VDDTQRAIVGGVGTAFLVAGISLLVIVSTAPGIPLVVSGAALVLIGCFWKKKPAGPVITAPAAPPPLTQGQRRAALRKQLEITRADGEKVNRSFDRGAMTAEHATWQPQVIELLESAFVRSEPAAWFADLGNPESGRDVTLMLRDQISHLGQLIRDLPQHTLKEYWQQP